MSNHQRISPIKKKKHSTVCFYNRNIWTGNSKYKIQNFLDQKGIKSLDIQDGGTKFYWNYQLSK